MIRVRLRYGDCHVEVATDSELHPDLLDEMTTRALRLFSGAHHTLLETQAAEGGESEDA